MDVKFYIIIGVICALVVGFCVWTYVKFHKTKVRENVVIDEKNIDMGVKAAIDNIKEKASIIQNDVDQTDVKKD